MPETVNPPAAPANAVIQNRGTFSELDLAAQSAKSWADKVVGQPDTSGDTDMMKQLNAAWEERRTGVPATPADEGEPVPNAPKENGDSAEPPKPGKPPALSAPKRDPAMKPKTAADWNAKEAAAEKLYQEKLTKERTAWESSVLEQQKELEELRQWRSAIDIESDPEFQREFKQQYDYLTSRVKNISGEKGKALTELLSMPESAARDGQIEEMISEFPETSKRMVRAVQGSLIELGLRRDAKVNEARLKASTYVERQKQQQQLIALQRKQTFSKVVDEAVARGIDAFAIGTDDAQHNRSATAMRAQAEQYFDGSGLDDHDRATVALWATLGPKYAQSYEAASARVSQLEARLARFEGSLPGGGDDGRLEEQGEVPRGGKHPANMSTEELQADMYKKLQQAQQNTWSDLRKAPNVYGQ